MVSATLHASTTREGDDIDKYVEKVFSAVKSLISAHYILIRNPYINHSKYELVKAVELRDVEVVRIIGIIRRIRLVVNPATFKPAVLEALKNEEKKEEPKYRLVFRRGYGEKASKLPVAAYLRLFSTPPICCLTSKHWIR